MGIYNERTEKDFYFKFTTLLDNHEFCSCIFFYDWHCWIYRVLQFFKKRRTSPDIYIIILYAYYCSDTQFF